MKKKNPIALVLSGGGARGFAHVGVIRELLAAGFEIGSIASTSMGALVGAAFACGKLDEFEEWITQLDRLKVFKLLDFTLGGMGFVRGERVFEDMESFLPKVNIEALDIPFAAVAVDLKTRKQVVFTEGDLFTAIRASAAIPTVMTPLHHNDQLLIDGGVLNNLPVDVVDRQSGDLLVAVNVGASTPVRQLEGSNDEDTFFSRIYSERIAKFTEWMKDIMPATEPNEMTLFDIVNRSMDIMSDAMVELRIKEVSVDILLELSRDTCGIFDFYRAEELVELGKLICKDKLNETTL